MMTGQNIDYASNLSLDTMCTRCFRVYHRRTCGCECHGWEAVRAAGVARGGG